VACAASLGICGSQSDWLFRLCPPMIAQFFSQGLGTRSLMLLFQLVLIKIFVRGTKGNLFVVDDHAAHCCVAVVE
jgi:hypothetical protein